MIKINLALKKSATLVDSGTKSQFSMGSLGSLRGMAKIDGSAMFAGLKSSRNIKRIALLVVAVVGGFYVMDDYKQEELKKEDLIIDAARAEVAVLRKKVTEGRKYDEIKKSLEADELVIRTKLETIQKLIQDRSMPPKLLVALSGATPKEVWLSDVNVLSSEVSLKGNSLDFSKVSEFMKNLNESVYFKDVTLKSTQQAGKDAGADQVVTFDVSVKRR